jgi:diguanylate cyclase (GGDEF)-like protein
VTPPRRFASLAGEALARFLTRYRRGSTIDRYEPRLDLFLREILARATEFAPSECGAFFLDDPRIKVLDSSRIALTLVAAYGGGADLLVGRTVEGERHLIGRVYYSGRSAVGDAATEGPLSLVDDAGSDLAVRSLLGVPVTVGNSVCGVLVLANRVGQDRYTDSDRTLFEIFAGYISSSIQNTLDGIRARELARRDDLTGLFNDRYFSVRLREEVARVKDGEDVCLVFLDLDRFKNVNDRHGHLEGSRLLHEVGVLLHVIVPEGAVAARYGGDEFVIILPGWTLENASSFAEDLRQSLERFRLDGEERVGSEISLTASLGVASLTRHIGAQAATERRANALVRLADSAMYRAKELGRNRVAVAERDDGPASEKKE